MRGVLFLFLCVSVLMLGCAHARAIARPRIKVQCEVVDLADRPDVKLTMSTEL